MCCDNDNLLCTKFSETLRNISSDIKRKPFQSNLNDLCDLEKKDTVMRFNLVSALPWCLCVTNLVRLHQIILQLLSRNHFSYPIALIDHCDLEKKVKITRFKPGLCHALVLLCTKFGKHTSNIYSNIKRKLF